MIEERIENYWKHRSESFSASIKEEMAGSQKNVWQLLIKRFAGDREKLRVLDVGTGPGFFAILMAQLGYQVTAVDVSEDMLNQARKNAEQAGVKINFFQGDAQKIDFPSGSFDLIASRNVTWTLPKPLEAYQEWHRLLAENGKVLVFDANWYLRLSDSELQKKYEESRKTAEEKGFRHQGVTKEQEKTCEDIARNLPLTYQKRPDWDRQALAECGFREVIIESNLNDLICDDLEKIANQVTPMFAICACK